VSSLVPELTLSFLDTLASPDVFFTDYLLLLAFLQNINCKVTFW
jgi:hypothetical protein